VSLLSDAVRSSHEGKAITPISIRRSCEPLLKTGRDMIKMIAYASERASALEAITIGR
jgi:hypothetical protein